MSTEFIVAQQEEIRDEATAIEAVFRERLAATGLAHDWSALDLGDDPALKAAATACSVADLIVAIQRHETIPASAGYSPDDLVLAAGRPVLIVPAVGDIAPVGKKLVAAWNGSREAARAVFDALPLLQDGAEMRVVVVDNARGNATLAALLRALDRHGVAAHGSAVSKGEGRSAAEQLLKAALENGADLLVLGCYGHSRLRETMFGGVTTRILRDMTLPLLMAH